MQPSSCIQSPFPRYLSFVAPLLSSWPFKELGRLTFRALKAAASSVVDPHIKNLWTYSCSLTDGRTVTCMSWNKQNQVGTYPFPLWLCFALVL